MATTEVDPDPKSRKVTVCSRCLTASCWHGVFMCDDSKTAGTVERTVAELDALGREHSSHYTVERVRDVTGRGPAMVLSPVDPGVRLRTLIANFPPALRALYMADTTFNALVQLAVQTGWSERVLLTSAVEYIAKEKAEAVAAYGKLVAEGLPPVMLTITPEHLDALNRGRAAVGMPALSLADLPLQAKPGGQ